MDIRKIGSPLLLLVTAIIWGFGFVAQKDGLNYMGPHGFNMARFFLGAACVLAFSLILDKQKRRRGEFPQTTWLKNGRPDRTLVKAGVFSGTFLFLGVAFQQVALQYTTAGRNAFITALYIVVVPVLAVFLKKKITPNVWAGIFFAALGFYFLCLKPGELAVGKGEILCLIGSLCWAIQILLIDHYSPQTDNIKMAAVEFLLTALLSAVFTFLLETFSWELIRMAAVPLLYSGILSVGLGFTFQIIGQKNTPPAIATLIMSLESVFAVIGGAWLLHETLTGRELLGCALIFLGVLLAQFPLQILFRRVIMKQQNKT
jgi:drug/metabolite transporter (DMT)-like permease